MKHLKNLSRIAVFATSIIWLMTRASVVYAQLQECYTYNAEEGNPCDTCCNGGSDEQGVSDGTITGPGIQILSSMFENCGSSASCPGPNPNGYCGTQSWLQAVDDPVDCCLPSGSPCNQGTCCNGLMCLSNNTCGTCIGGGGACGANSDCCSSVCCNGTCTNNICSCPDTALCDDYTTFATDYCMYPQGGCPTGYYASNYCCYNGTPIVIDAFKEGFHLTSEIAGVNFHIHRNGPLYRVSWTDPQWHNGWLALDRNGNGTIDDFTELFGNLTPQPPSRTPNGYAALAVFDDPANGGNGNGVIDPGDSVYDKLRVWIDANHNGFSEPNELHTLRELDIRRIGLTYTLSQYVDANGNQFRYRAHIWDKAGAAHNACYDVILQVLPLNN